MDLIVGASSFVLTAQLIVIVELLASVHLRGYDKYCRGHACIYNPPKHKQIYMWGGGEMILLRLDTVCFMCEEQGSGLGVWFVV